MCIHNKHLEGSSCLSLRHLDYYGALRHVKHVNRGLRVDNLWQETLMSCIREYVYVCRIVVRKSEYVFNHHKNANLFDGCLLKFLYECVEHEIGRGDSCT